ncbi:hypothetical protein LDENG_00174880 [Lucifuga dentata]|nr:hypothetical protein LDENG_00174880 [Lucifuga dentata]
MYSLMADVTNQGYSVNGRRWQLPCDLTRRNYQMRFGNTTPRMSLSEWYAQNNPTRKRFATVPKIFKRSPIPKY